MQARSRSLAGAAMAVFALPVFIGLTACLPTFPVPVGNPEKSSIDPTISGAWLAADDEQFWVFEPYDKRTWLITAFSFEEDPEGCEAGAEPATEALSYYEETMAQIAAVGAACFELTRDPGAIKVWRTRFRGEWFMTWELKGEGAFDGKTGFAPTEWYVFHIDTSVPGELRLGWVDTDFEVWDKLTLREGEEITRAAVERVFRKHADDEGFYGVDDQDVLRFYRVKPEHHALIAELISDGLPD